MKKLISLLLALILLASTAGAVELYVDTNLIETDVPPMVVNDRTLVPVRVIFEAIGATVTWDNETSTAAGVRGDTTVVIQIDNTTAYVNGEPYVLDVPAQLINDRTMVPARFISEAMGCEVSWYDETETVGVADKTKGQQIYVTKTGEKYHYDSSCNGGTYYEATLAEAMGRGLTPCDKCALTDLSSTNPNNAPAGNPGNADHFNTYDNPDQQKTEDTWVLNINTMKIHYPSCREVKKIAPQNYSTSNLSESELIAQGYTVCGVCHK